MKILSIGTYRFIFSLLSKYTITIKNYIKKIENFENGQVVFTLKQIIK